MLALEKIHAKGKKAGVVVKPKTPAEAVLPFLERGGADSGDDRGAGLRRAEVHGGHDAQGPADPQLDRRA